MEVKEINCRYSKVNKLNIVRKLTVMGYDSVPRYTVFCNNNKFTAYVESFLNVAVDVSHRRIFRLVARLLINLPLLSEVFAKCNRFHMIWCCVLLK